MRCDYVDYKTRRNFGPVITRPLYSDLENNRASPSNLHAIAYSATVIDRVSIFFPIRREISRYTDTYSTPQHNINSLNAFECTHPMQTPHRFNSREKTAQIFS